MFFILSKVLVYLLKPIIWIFLLLLLALFSKKHRRKKRSLLGALLILFVFSNHFLFNSIVGSWEVDTITAEQISDAYDIGILLGGYSNSNTEARHDLFNFNSRANRFNNAIELYFRGKVKKLLLTGGSGSLLPDAPKEASAVYDYLLTIGIPAEDIIIESESRNTRENALFSTAIIKEKYPAARCLLITSAWHMRRSHACFEKAGLDCTPFSVDYMSEKHQFTLPYFLLPSSGVLGLWEALIKEWVGYSVYVLTGYI